MINCPSCRKQAVDGSRFCDECGSRLVVDPPPTPVVTDQPAASDATAAPNFQQAAVTSIEIPPVIEKVEPLENINGKNDQIMDSLEISAKDSPFTARLVIERGDALNTEFVLNMEESQIGRWDADNGIFPDIDLDAFDTDAKVSRKHARIRHKDGIYTIEDLGSTNGTFINRGRRLLPGTPQVLRDGDEIIVGKTFLRFKVNQ